MIDMIKDFLKQLLIRKTDEPELDRAMFDDEVAYLTSFKPATGLASNFTTHRLKKDKQGNYIYRSTLLAKMIGLPFLGFGLVPLVLDPGEFYAWVFGIVFISGGSLIFYQTFKKTIFDDSRRMFSSGIFAKPANSISYEFIHALQVIAKQVNGTDESGPYIAYELNIVDHQGNRKNVHVYSGEKAVLADAAILSQHLEVPQWLAI